jgi:CRISPR/Cas system-associated protein Cas10 (large subunit of type III CRISPR-Cas system)
VTTLERYLLRHWNRCDVCGRFVALEDFESGRATRRLETPDSDYSSEAYETLCARHVDSGERRWT